MSANATIDYRNIYGTTETNGLVDGCEYHKIERESVDWCTPGLKITRLRLVTDIGHPTYDVSYCHGVLNGKPVDIMLPFFQIPIKTAMSFLIAQAKEDGVYAKGLGILDKANWSVLK